MSNDRNAATTTTTIGPSIVIRGKLRSDEDLIVKGRIDAEITSGKALMIENSGIVNADVQVESLRVSGVLVGNITAASRGEIASDGRVVGDILAPKIVISDGAAFRGRIDMQNFDEAGSGLEERASSARPAAPEPAPVATAPAPVESPPPDDKGPGKGGPRRSRSKA
jgi:cytoskeletal protein CcmA (bactofilin family)